ncbi:hypothetical protein ACFV0R_01815 [Streptomyces sp. NPDC059578]|uniref:hypothetical protein n=1 Tax=unclassified Streptomyces TaxID=2593676 RepID=UPI00365528DA
MSENPEGRAALLARAAMFGSALSAGVVLVLAGGATPVEASAYVAPFLMFLHRGAPVPGARGAARRQLPRAGGPPSPESARE